MRAISAAVLGRGLARDQLVEVALLAASRGLLMQQREAALVELLEPLIPLDGFEGICAGVAGEIKANDADIALVAGAAYARRFCAAFLCPLPDLVMVCCDRCRCS
jgi:hypothetical protein